MLYFPVYRFYNAFYLKCMFLYPFDYSATTNFCKPFLKVITISEKNKDHKNHEKYFFSSLFFLLCSKERTIYHKEDLRREIFTSLKEKGMSGCFCKIEFWSNLKTFLRNLRLCNSKTQYIFAGFFERKYLQQKKKNDCLILDCIFSFSLASTTHKYFLSKQCFWISIILAHEKKYLFYWKKG